MSGSFFKNVKNKIFRKSRIKILRQEQLLFRVRNDIINKFPESLLKYGYSVYSQNEEDGILAEILRRIGVSKTTFIEFGVHPQENNTNNLLLQGAKGVWVDKSLSSFKAKQQPPKELLIIDKLVHLENIVQILKESGDYLGIENWKGLDLLSLDLDGNDYYFIERILENKIFPKVFCLEYNSKFSPPHEIKIKYDPAHRWRSDDYMGCSLQSYVGLMNRHQYSLICCNITGSNCFFIRNDFKQHFHAYNTEELYQPSRYYLSPFYKGHMPTMKFLQNI